MTSASRSFGVSSAAGGGLLRRGSRGPAEDTQLESGPQGENCRPRPRPQIGPGGDVQGLEHAEDVAVRFEFACHIRTAYAELAGSPEHPADGVRRPDGERPRPVGRSDPATVPELESHRQPVAEEPLEERGNRRRGLSVAPGAEWFSARPPRCRHVPPSQFRLHHVGFHGPSFVFFATNVPMLLAS